MYEVAAAYWQGVADLAGIFGPFAPAERIVVDSANQILTIVTKGVPIAVPLYSPVAFRQLSRHWVRVGWSLGYYGGFKWMGRRVLQLPQDLIRLQEAVYEVQPDVIVETGVCDGGSLLYLASLCRILGKGRVIGIDIQILRDVRESLEKHLLSPHITLIEGSSTSTDVVDKVKAICRPGETVMIILDSAHESVHVRRELELYAPLISAGSYLIAQDGVMQILADVPGGDVTWLWDNPAVAVMDFLSAHSDFALVPPPGLNLWTDNVTYWPYGWLKKVR